MSQERLRWWVSCFLLVLECDTPIVEAALWGRNWAYIERIGNSIVPITVIPHDPARKLTRLPNHLVIHRHRTVVGKWNPTTKTIDGLTEMESALAVALGYTTT